MAVIFRNPLGIFSSPPILSRQPHRILRCSVENKTLQSFDTRKLVLEVKEKLEREYPVLPLGINGRDDEDMILWFLKDRKFSVEDAVAKLTQAITSNVKERGGIMHKKTVYYARMLTINEACLGSRKQVYATIHHKFK